ncbi:MAG: hypothetical protein ACI9QD_000126 [Thermoproteota archaeon]|jgi:hypothetical protein
MFKKKILLIISFFLVFNQVSFAKDSKEKFNKLFSNTYAEKLHQMLIFKASKLVHIFDKDEAALFKKFIKKKFPFKKLKNALREEIKYTVKEDLNELFLLLSSSFVGSELNKLYKNHDEDYIRKVTIYFNKKKELNESRTKIAKSIIARTAFEILGDKSIKKIAKVLFISFNKFLDKEGHTKLELEIILDSIDKQEILFDKLEISKVFYYQNKEKPKSAMIQLNRTLSRIFVRKYFNAIKEVFIYYYENQYDEYKEKI